MTLRGRGVAALAAILVGCAGPTPAPTQLEGPAIQAGYPYEADEILEAMRTSRRPDGVPEELQTDAVASSVAGAIWTTDGQPWTTIAIGGSCGPAECTLDVSGSHAEGEDAWTFLVIPAEPRVETLTAHIAAGRDLAARADAHARASTIGPELADLILASASWEPPPRAGVLRLAYREGNEEGSCGRDVVVEVLTGGVSIAEERDC